MSAGFKWIGLAEQVAQLQSLVPDLVDTAAPEVEAAAQAAKTTIYNGYPRRTGDLRDQLRVDVVRDAAGGVTKAVVINTSRHAAVFEHGSQARHTAIGANRGSMPAHPIFVASMIRERRQLFASPIPQVLTEMGLQVVGDGA